MARFVLKKLAFVKSLGLVVESKHKLVLASCKASTMSFRKDWFFENLQNKIKSDLEPKIPETVLRKKKTSFGRETLVQPENKKF